VALAPPRPCAHPKCGRLRCRTHQAVAWRPVDRDPSPRVRGRQLQQLREQLFTREPWCRSCARVGRRCLATIRDHIVALAEGGRDDDANTQPLCRACSDLKTRAESARGRAREQQARGGRKSL